MTHEELFGDSETDGPFEIGRKLFDAYIDDEENFIFPMSTDGKPTNLDDYDGFLVENQFGEIVELEADEFFSVYIPSRLLHRGIGCG